MAPVSRCDVDEQNLANPVSAWGGGRRLQWAGAHTHADGVGGVQLAAMRALTDEGTSHVAAHAVHTGAGFALVDI